MNESDIRNSQLSINWLNDQETHIKNIKDYIGFLQTSVGNLREEKLKLEDALKKLNQQIKHLNNEITKRDSTEPPAYDSDDILE